MRTWERASESVVGSEHGRPLNKVVTPRSRRVTGDVNKFKVFQDWGSRAAESSNMLGEQPNTTGRDSVT